MKELSETRDIERSYEQRDVQKSADDRYWEAERAERNGSIGRIYKMPFPRFVERFDEAMVLGDLYEMMLDKSIGYYLLTVARMRYFQTVKTE